MADGHRFYRSEAEWLSFADGLKHLACPRCHKVGFLIRHGVLPGRDDASPKGDVIRAHRIYCSNRGRRPGCGRTFSVWAADKIRRLSMTTRLIVGRLKDMIIHGGETVYPREIEEFL